MKRKNLNILIQLGGLAVLVAVLLSINWREYFLILSGCRLSFLVIAILLNFLRLFIEAWRWKYLIGMQGISYGMKDAFLASLNSIYIGSVTPGDVGNFLKVFYLSEDKDVSIGLSLSNTVADKLIDLLIFVGLGLWGLAAIRMPMGLFFGAAGWLALVLVFLFWVTSSEKLHTYFAKKFSSFPKMEKFDQNIEANRMDFYKGFEVYFKDPAILVPIAMTFLSFLCFFGQAYFLVGAIHVRLSLWQIAALMAVSILASRVVPVSFSGLGSKDLTMVMLFKNFGATTAQGITFSLLFLFTSFIVPIALGAASWLIKPIKIGE